MSDVEKNSNAADRTGTPETPMADGVVPVKIIKRYTNRKLYDTVESRYVTLEEIAEMVKGGVEVQILDNRTKEDLTSVTLAQIIFEEEKRQGQMPLNLLKRIIQGGGEVVSEFISEQVTPRVDAIREGAETRVGRLFKREAEVANRGGAHMRELFSSSQRALDEWQRRIDENVRSAVDAVTNLNPLHREIQRLNERIEQLEKKISELERDQSES